MSHPGLVVRENWQIDFPALSEEVDVSIIVCAYNKSEYTMQCLSALQDTLAVNTTTVEVILVDDASNDDTQEIFSTVRNLRYLRLDLNLGFLRAANFGARQAKGKYVLFLNNDTIPIGNWLDILKDTFYRHPNAAIVGSQLLYPNGIVQEAGGIIFNDATGWNYGKRFQGTDPRIGYERKVDYCSGASIMVRMDFWRNIGGFNEVYAPAYYEDTDLSFNAWNSGYEVWVQPQSRVIHYEGISHGTDESKGLKRYQVINAENFKKVWENNLQLHHQPNANKVWGAAHRHYRGSIIVFDEQIPMPDVDSGSLRMVEILLSLRRLNYHVTFVPVNGLRKFEYSDKLEAAGIEIFNIYAGHLDLIAERLPFLTAVWVCRPGPTKRFFDDYQSYFPGVPVIFDTIDLHFSRIRRQAMLERNEDLYRQSLMQEMIEFDLIGKSDATIVVSTAEEELLNARSKRQVFVLPNVHAENVYDVSPVDRSGLLFVGSFEHTPNVDAIEWMLAEIWPALRREFPKLTLRIVGAKPPVHLVEIAPEGVTFTGWLKELDEEYQNARIVIAPLRYGAGVKGKVGQAMAFGVPTVVTQIAAEGMQLTDGFNCLVAETSQDFVTAIGRLVSDDHLWESISRQGLEDVERNFGRTSMDRKIFSMLENVSDRRSKVNN